MVAAGTAKRNPAKLAAQINAEHDAARADAQSAMQRVRKCGELLMQAKAQTKHGEWEQWIEANLTFGARQAQKYIRLAETWDRLPNANSGSLLPSINAALSTVAEPRAASAKASKPHTKAKPIRVSAVEVPASRVQIVLDELDRPEALTPERTAHAVALVREMLTTGDAKTASIEQVATMRHPPAATLPPAAQPDPRDDPDVAEADHRLKERMVTPADFEALQVIRWMGSLDVGSLTDPALILTEMHDYLGYMKKNAGIVDASRTIAAAATALAAAFTTTEPIKAADRAAMDKRAACCGHVPRALGRPRIRR